MIINLNYPAVGVGTTVSNLFKTNQFNEFRNTGVGITFNYPPISVDYWKSWMSSISGNTFKASVQLFSEVK